MMNRRVMMKPSQHSNTNVMKSSPNQTPKLLKPKTESRFSKTNQMKKSQLEPKKLRKEQRNRNSLTYSLKVLLKWTTTRTLKIKNGVKSNKNTTVTPSSLKRQNKFQSEPYKPISSKRTPRLSLSKFLNTSRKLPSLSKEDNHGLDYSKSQPKLPQLLQFKPTRTWSRKSSVYAMNF